MTGADVHSCIVNGGRLYQLNSFHFAKRLRMLFGEKSLFKRVYRDMAKEHFIYTKHVKSLLPACAKSESNERDSFIYTSIYNTPSAVANETLANNN